MRRWMTAVPVVAAYALSAAVFSRLPIAARPDLSPLLPIAIPDGGPASRVAAALLLPTLALGLWAMFNALATVRGPRTPLPEWWLNEETGAAAVSRFESTYSTITFAVTALIALMHVGLIGGMLGWPAWSYRVLTAVLGLGIIAAGNVMPRTRPNWIVGLRTKRALSSPAVWLRTHRMLGALMMVSGVLVLIASALAPEYALLTAVVSLLAAFVAAHALGAAGATPTPVVVVALIAAATGLR